jgi:hypothetical protein
MEDAISDDTDIDAIAAALRADTAESGTLLDVVALKLEDALPSLTEVDRYSSLGRNRGHVKRVQLTLGDKVFTLQRRHHIEATVAHVVGGITLATDELDADVWLRDLIARMAELSADQTRIRQALDQLVLGQRD